MKLEKVEETTWLSEQMEGNDRYLDIKKIEDRKQERKLTKLKVNSLKRSMKLTYQ